MRAHAQGLAARSMLVAGCGVLACTHEPPARSHTSHTRTPSLSSSCSSWIQQQQQQQQSCTCVGGPHSSNRTSPHARPCCPQRRPLSAPCTQRPCVLVTHAPPPTLALPRPLSPNFFLSHSLYMGNLDLSTGSKQLLKTSVGTYEFGANVISDRYMLLVRGTASGRQGPAPHVARDICAGQPNPPACPRTRTNTKGDTKRARLPHCHYHDDVAARPHITCALRVHNALLVRAARARDPPRGGTPKPPKNTPQLIQTRHARCTSLP